MSGLRHHSRSKFVQLRWDYLALADGNHCAAKILSVLEFRTNQLKMQAAALSRAARQWIYKRLVDWRTELMEEHSVGVIRRAIKLLQDKGLIDVTNNFKRNRAGAEFNGQDKTNQYRMNFDKVYQSLEALQRSNLSFSTPGDSNSTPQESDLNSEVSETANIIGDSIANSIAHPTADKVAAVEEEVEMQPDWDAVQTQVAQWEENQLTVNQEEPNQSTDTLCIDEPEQVTPSNETIIQEDKLSAVASASTEKPSPEEIRDVCNELRQIPCTPAFRLSPEMMTVINKHWQNVPGALAYLKEALRTWKRVDSPEAVFVGACKNGKKPEKMVVVTGFKEWYQWAYRQRLVQASTVINGEHQVFLATDEWISAHKAMQLHPME
jgi:hypothetical protein